MKKKWPTKVKDLSVAQHIIEQYAEDKDSEVLGLFELVFNVKEKRLNFQLASWVVNLAKKFNAIYGAEDGDTITRHVISHCLIQDETLH